MPSLPHHIEIMSPVGSYESLMAAIQGGAHAVYFGVGKLNMRSRSSQNFTLEDLSQIAEIAHTNNLRTYLTLNTVIFDDEMQEVQSVLEKAKQSGISAVIASDISVMENARRVGLPVHISTQCNITNFSAVKFFSKYADVMVMARELNLEQVSSITTEIIKQDVRGPAGELVRIEMFAHGALCMAVSGKCYLSLDNYNYSANRGACLQLCRRGYTVSDKEGEFELDIDNQYIMSPKDLCTLPFLDKLIASGVSVLKIEGRGRGPEYVKTVTRVYREASEAFLDGSFHPDKVEQWMERLRRVYNRDFWDGYYLGRKTGEWTEEYGSQATHRKVYVGKITNYFSKLGVAEVKMETGELQSHDEIYITGPTTGVIEMQVAEIRVDLQPVSATRKGEMCSFKVPELVRRGDKVYKIVEIS